MKIPFNRRIEKDLIEALKKYADSQRKTDTQVIEDALRDYLTDKGHWPPN